MNISRSASLLVLALALSATGTAVFAQTSKTRGVSGRGLTLPSVNMTLPADSAVFPDGPHADTVNANCLSCHSASMVLYQPRLAAADWRKIVEKMRDAYGAPVEAADIPVIVDYLATLSAKTPAR